MESDDIHLQLQFAFPRLESESQPSVTTDYCFHTCFLKVKLPLSHANNVLYMEQKAATQTTAAELARILYWLMVVGYSIRNIEVRYDMERVLGMPAKLAELPPGEKL